MPLALSSSAFADQGEIPSHYTCEGQDVSPPLSWSGVPANAKSLVQRMGGRDSMFEPHFRFEDLIEVALSDDEYGLLALVDGHRSLYELCTKGPLAAADNAPGAG